MIIRETKNLNEIKKVLCHPEIYDRIADDYCGLVEDFEPSLDDEHIVGLINGEIIGLMVYYVKNEQLRCHFQVLPEYRQYSKQFARMALDIGKAKNAPIFAEIPINYPEVIKFTTNFGFKIIGNIVDGYKKNGHLYDVNILRYDNELCSQ